jgi:hypothetical protein
MLWFRPGSFRVWRVNRGRTRGFCRGRAMKRTSLPLRRREFITLIGGAAHPTILETAPH